MARRKLDTNNTIFCLRIPSIGVLLHPKHPDTMFHSESKYMSRVIQNQLHYLNASKWKVPKIYYIVLNVVRGPVGRTSIRSCSTAMSDRIVKYRCSGVYVLVKY